MKGRINKNISFSILLIISVVILCPPLSASQYRLRQHHLVDNAVLESDIIAEINFGKEVAARILGREERHIDNNLSRYVSLIGKSLTLHSNRSEITYFFTVIKNDFANAFSAPGGYVFITTGALQLAQDESEIAAILAHEIAHISTRHIINNLNIRGDDNSSYSGITRILSVFSDMTKVALNQAADKAIDILYKQGYELKEEYEADDVAMQLLAETGYDPTALHRYLARVNKQKDSVKLDKSSTRTHPLPETRLEQISRNISTEDFDQLNLPRMRSRFRKNMKLHN